MNIIFCELSGNVLCQGWCCYLNWIYFWLFLGWQSFKSSLCYMFAKLLNMKSFINIKEGFLSYVTFQIWGTKVYKNSILINITYEWTLVVIKTEAVFIIKLFQLATSFLWKNLCVLHSLKINVKISSVKKSTPKLDADKTTERNHFQENKLNFFQFEKLMRKFVDHKCFNTLLFRNMSWCKIILNDNLLFTKCLTGLNLA